MTTVTIDVLVLPHGQDLPLPTYQSAGAAGLDLLAAVHADLVLAPAHRALVPTGIAVAIPEGFEAQVRPRSGLALKRGVTVLNSPGTIDSDYRGEIGVVMINLGQEDVTIHRGDRIAQLVVAAYVKALLRAVASLERTDRSQGGFGSTGE